MATRTTYLRQLESLDREIAEMGDRVKEVYERARVVAAAGIYDDGNALEEADSDISARERAIESAALRLLLLQQPVAGDLRDVSGSLKMVTDLRRIGDLSLDVCRIVSNMDGRSYPVQREGMSKMSSIVSEMVDNAANSFTNRNIEQAELVISKDDEVDNWLVTLRNDIIQQIFDKKIDAQDAVDLLMIAKYFERIADHAENVARWTSYVVTGSYGEKKEG